MKRKSLYLCFLALVCTCASLSAATFTVTTTNDTGAGSLRAAIASANGAPGATNLIQFNILPTNTLQTITPVTQLPTITRPVLIDGYTQPGASSNTLVNADNAVLVVEINGAILGNNGDALVIAPTAGGSTVRGLVIDNGWSRGILVRTTNTVVEGCFIGTDPTGLIARGNTEGVKFEFSFDSSFSRLGGTNVAARNVLSGNGIGTLIQAGSNQVVQGNFIGVDKTGTNGLTASGQGIQVNGPSNVQIGGTNAAARNVIACGVSGTGILVSGSTGTRIQGNFIGTDATGSIGLGLTTAIRVDNFATATQIGGLAATPGTPPGNVLNAVGFSGGGLVMDGSTSSNVIQGNLVGTDATGTRAIGIVLDGVQIVGAFNTISSNVIAAGGRFGIYMDGDHGIVHGNLIQGNFIGTDITGTNLLGNVHGVVIDRSFANSFSNNVIAGNSGVGVIVTGFNATNNAVLANSIFANGSVGIDLSSGGNLSQTNPVITGVAIGPGTASLDGSLKSGTNTICHLEFFSNASCDGSGSGEGRTFLGFTNVTTDASGNATFALALPNPSGGAVFTATATDTNGNTSEFSACASVSGPCTIVCPANMLVSTAPNQCGAVVNFSPTTSGNCGAVNSSPQSGSFFPKGITTVTCTTASGTNCSFTVTVNDTIPPTIACPANIVTNVPLVETSAVVNYAAPAVTDNCGVVSTNSSPPSGSIFPLGVTVVTCTATDTSGNTNLCSFTVTVMHSNAQPVAVCRNVTTNAVASCDANVTPAAVDNGSFDPDGTIVSRVLNPTGPYPKGTNLVTLTVIDNQGGSNSCTANFIVVDTTPPAISCPANIVTNAPPGQSSLAINYSAPVVTDNCTGVATNATPPSGSVFLLGTTTVNCTAIDSSGNSNTCSFTVTVNPTAAERFWTNTLGGNYQTPANWLGNVVPGVLDNAHFTSNATYQVTWTSDAAAANAFFDASSGIVTQAIGSRAWLVTNSYVVGQNVGSIATVDQVSGTLRVTNSAGTAVLDVRRGTNRLDAGLIDVDQVVMTNTAGRFEFNGGTLIMRGGAIANGNTVFTVGANGSTPAIWDVRAGGNVIDTSTFMIGSNVPGCQLLITNGGKLFSSAAFVGFNATSSSNSVFVSGSNSILHIDGFLGLSSGSGNQIQISNGGGMTNDMVNIGTNPSSSNNLVRVTGPGSTWISTGVLIGFQGPRNRMIVENGGLAVVKGNSQIGGSSLATANSNSVLVTGSGSVWTNAGFINVGNLSAASSLVISNGGAVHANALTIGNNGSSTNNRSVVDGGSLRVTNATLSAPLEIRRGTNQLNSGLIEADVLILTNALGNFEFNGGTLNVRTSIVANGQRFFVGNGVDAALLNLVGNGVHSFTNAVTLRSNATLAGNGAISNVIIMQNGARLVPGLPQGGIGKMFLGLPPALDGGAVVMEISKIGTVLTNDQIQLAGTVTYGASLIVSNLGPSALESGDRFRLFSATDYKNIFLSLILPPLPAGLGWANKLAVDGSIEVIGIPRFEAIVQSGTNLVISGSAGPTNASYTVLASTNVALALASWTRLLTNQFDNFGNFIFTNGINPFESRRFYRLQMP